MAPSTRLWGPTASIPVHTRIGFAVRHMAVSKVRGGFNRFEGTLDIAEDPADSTVSVTIDADSVDTRDENRDNHLRTNDFFDVANHPTWTFVSTGDPPVTRRHWKVDGDLTIRGATRPVTLDAEPRGRREGPLRQPSGGLQRSTPRSTVTNSACLRRGHGGRRAGRGKKVDIQIEAEAVLQSQ